MAGVAGGLARRFGIDPTLVRIGFVVLGVSGGSGVAVYVALWLALPLEDEPTSIGQRAWHDRRTTALMIGLGAFLVLVVLMLRALSLWFIGGFLWPLALAAAGLPLSSATGTRRS